MEGNWKNFTCSGINYRQTRTSVKILFVLVSVALAFQCESVVGQDMSLNKVDVRADRMQITEVFEATMCNNVKPVARPFCGLYG